ncbi:MULTISPECIES: hypothetical protein [unclassified Amycolatopsis]|uniref:hypothetical protein n=1 Tax=unclassified Amycolatopsis TaxID=2618356 RepID=UPI001A8C7FD3|nr:MULTISPECIES: hypothetical protein [unclassified Amycolatopsis]HET6704097.1 hypothetical protein [Amycolatopsis sp.]
MTEVAGFACLTGPVDTWDPAIAHLGYRPVTCFAVSLPDVRGLRIRLCAHHAAGQVPQDTTAAIGVGHGGRHRAGSP